MSAPALWIRLDGLTLTLVTLRQGRSCDSCGKALRKGQRAYRYPLVDKTYAYVHVKCGQGMLDPTVFDVKVQL